MISIRTATQTYPRYDIPAPTGAAAATLGGLYTSGRLADVIEWEDYWRLFPSVVQAPPPPPELNSLYWPVHGASRYARGYFLLDYYSLGRLRADLGSGSRVLLSYTDDDDGVPTETPREVSLHLIDARPVSRTNDGLPPAADPMLDPAGPQPDDLWLLTLVDRRYFWNQTLGFSAPAAGASWEALLGALGSALTGVTAVQIDPIPPSYRRPSSRWRDPNLGTYRTAHLFDAAAHAVGGRVVVSPTDSRVYVQRPTERLRCSAVGFHSVRRACGVDLTCVVRDGSDGSTTTANPASVGCSTTTTTTTSTAPPSTTTTTRDPRFVAGGFTEGDAELRTAPAGVRVVFTSVGEVLSTVTVPLADCGLPAYAGVVPVSGTAVLDWSDLEDEDGRDLVAREQAKSFYMWRLAPVDAVYGGFLDVPANGYFDHVVYAHADGVSRVFRGPVNPSIDMVKPPEGLPSSPSTSGPGTGTQPACCGTCRWDWSVGSQVYVLGHSPCMNAAGCYCSPPPECPPDPGLSVCVYTPCATLPANGTPPTCTATTTTTTGTGTPPPTTTTTTAAPTPPPGCNSTFSPTSSTATLRPCRTEPCLWYCGVNNGAVLRNPMTSCGGESGCIGTPACPSCDYPSGWCDEGHWCSTTVTPCRVCPPTTTCRPAKWCTGVCWWIWVTDDLSHDPPNYWMRDPRRSSGCYKGGSCGGVPCLICACDPPNLPGGVCGEPVSTECYCHAEPTTSTTADPCAPPTLPPDTTTSTTGPCQGRCAFKSNADATAWMYIKGCVGCGCSQPLGLPASNCAVAFTACDPASTTSSTATTTTTGTGTTTTTTSTAPPLYCQACPPPGGVGPDVLFCNSSLLSPTCRVVGGPYPASGSTCAPSCTNPWYCFESRTLPTTRQCKQVASLGDTPISGPYPTKPDCDFACNNHDPPVYCWACAEGLGTYCQFSNPFPAYPALCTPSGPWPSSVGCPNTCVSTTSTAPPTTTTTTTTSTLPAEG